MNIWSLDKDDTIKCLLLLLQQSFGHKRLCVFESNCLHPQAVRIGEHNNPATVYLYTYGQSEFRYGIHLEYDYREETNISEREEIYENIDYDKLLEILQVHFQ